MTIKMSILYEKYYYEEQKVSAIYLTMTMKMNEMKMKIFYLTVILQKTLYRINVTFIQVTDL